MATRSAVTFCALSILTLPHLGCTESTPGPVTGIDAGASGSVELVVLHTGDEHGWLLPHASGDGAEEVGGAANVMGWWREIEGVEQGSRHLILSSGDSWTGPTISTCLDGESTVDVMNAMGYAASAFGNHEWDFGLDELADRISEASFPYLGANILDTESGQVWDYVEPYTMVEVAGVSVGIIGLTLHRTPDIVFPSLIEGLQFEAYETTLERVVPEVRNAGAEVVIVVAHDGVPALAQLFSGLDVEVDLFLGGHDHSVADDATTDSLAVSSGSRFGGYSRIGLTFDLATRRVTDRTVEHVELDTSAEPVASPDAEITTLVAYWEEQSAVCEGETIAYSSDGIPNGGWAMANWVTDSWRQTQLMAPVDVAMTNVGGLRAAIPAGAVTEGDLMTMMPFDNDVWRVEMTGADLRSELYRAVRLCPAGGCCVAVSGIYYEKTGSSLEVILDDGTPLDDGGTYSVLVTDYIYTGGDGFTFFELGLEPYETGLNYRDPVIDVTRRLGTTEADPLEWHIDPAARDRLEYAEIIGYTETGIPRGSWTMANWVTDAWRAARTDADVALLDSGAMGTHLPAGAIRVGTLVSMLPWDRELVEVDLTGSELVAALDRYLVSCADEGCYAAISGMAYSTDGSVAMTTPDGTPIGADTTYRLVTTYPMYNALVPDGVPGAAATGISWREPVIDFTRALATSSSDPLEAHLDPDPRGP